MISTSDRQDAVQLIDEARVGGGYRIGIAQSWQAAGNRAQ